MVGHLTTGIPPACQNLNKRGVKPTPTVQFEDIFDFACLLNDGYHQLHNDDVPQSREEMLQSPKRDKWLAAERKEIQSLEDIGVFEGEVDIPPGVKLVPTKWVYKTKDNVTLEQADKDKRAGGTFEKVRGVAVGCAQLFKGLTVADLYAPTGKNVVFRLLMILMLVYGLMCEHLDVNTAFLYALLDTPVYMRGFPGYECAPGKCLKAVRALYGLRNAPKAWFDTIKKHILEQGYRQSTLDPCLFFRHITNSIILILIYVDDIIIFAKERATIDEVVQMFKSRYTCKNLGVLKRFIGIDVEVTSSSVTLTQRPYAEKVCHKFLEWSEPLFKKPNKMPLPYDTADRLHDESLPERGDAWYDWWSSFPYMQIIGALLYLAINTRPDLMFAVCMLARYSHKRTMQACYLVTHVLSYLSGTLDFNIKYTLNALEDASNFGMLGYSDADWGGDGWVSDIYARSGRSMVL